MEKTVTKIAEESGISQGFLSNILAGRRRPHYRKAKDIARVTGTQVDLWMEGTPDEMSEAIGKKKETA